MIEHDSDAYTISVMPLHHVSRLLDIPERTVRRSLLRAMEKLSADGQLESLFALAQCAQREDYGPTIRCGSVECLPKYQLMGRLNA
jgi:hypothetical protein